MRIAMIAIHSSPVGRLGTRDTGGMSVYVRALAEELGRCGHQVDIFTRRSEENRSLPASMTLSANVRLVHLHVDGTETVSKNALFSQLDRYTAALDRFRQKEGIQYHLIHSNYWLSGRMGRELKRRWRRPHVITFHTLGAVKETVYPDASEPPQRIASEKELVHSCDRILAPTKGEKHHLVSHYRANAEHIGMVPCGVDFSLFRPMDPSRCRQRIGLAQDDRVALFVGRFDPMKGLEHFIAAIAHLKGHPHLKAVIVGGDGNGSPERHKLRELARSFDIENQLIFAGSMDQKDMPLYYNAADVVVIPSRYESFGLVALEAMACGTPVVATPVGIMAEIVSSGKNGLLVRNASAEHLAPAVEEFITGPDHLNVQTIRSTIAKFDWSRIVRILIREYAATMADSTVTE